jgi:signal peptidase I
MKHNDFSTEKATGSAGKSDAPVKKKNTVREYTESFVIAIILALIIRGLVVQAFKIPSGSMEDTLLVGDHLLVNKFIYGTKIPFTDKRILKVRDPRRGDVIVFLYPEDAENPDLRFWQKKDFIKRIVGIPGDRVKMVDQVVYVNGKPYRIPQEVHKGASQDEQLLYNFPEKVVPPGEYFVMGDNRDNSRDSRFWGFVRRDYIKGLAFIKYFSWDNINRTIRWNRIGKGIE